MLAFLHATDGGWKTVRQMSHGCFHTRVSQDFCSLCQVSASLEALFTENKQPQLAHLPDSPFGSFEMLQILVFSSSSVSLCRFLPHCLCISISTRLFFPCFSLSRSISPWSSGDKSLFYCREFLSHCTTDSSPRSKTRRGPNPILPPSISPSLPPSGPDYRDSGRVTGRAGEMLEEGITPLHPRRGKQEREDAQHVDTKDRRGGGKFRHQEHFWPQRLQQSTSRSKLQNMGIKVQADGPGCRISCIRHSYWTNKKHTTSKFDEIIIWCN